ncbi:MAG TPA: hypothetical protein DCL21_03475 [Alphaproteobacteria bacterium]|nr:hypothetical protein [Alphaproteobacteria bacterium]
MSQTKKKEMPNPAFDHSSEFVVNQPAEQKQTTEKKDSCTLGKYTFATLAIGKGANRYIAIFKKITQGKFIIPSKPAAFFGLSWLIYRRASYYAFPIYAALVFILYQLFTTMAFLPKVIQFIAIFGIAHIIFFLAGNFLYWYSVRKKIDKFRKLYGDTSAMTYLSEQGGTLSGFNLIAAVVSMQGTILVTVYGCLYIDDFFISVWDSFLSLALL